MKPNKGEEIPKELLEYSRWANEDLVLEYAYQAIECKEHREHCMSLWFPAEIVRELYTKSEVDEMIKLAKLRGSVKNETKQ